MLFSDVAATVPSGRHSISSLADNIEVPMVPPKDCFASEIATVVDDQSLCRRRSSMLNIISLARQLSDDAEEIGSVIEDDSAVAPVWAPGCFESAAEADAAAAASIAAAMDTDQVVPDSVIDPGNPKANVLGLAPNYGARFPQSRSPSPATIFTVIDSTTAVSDDSDTVTSLPNSPVPRNTKVKTFPGASRTTDRKSRKKESNRRAAAKFRQKKKKALETTTNQIKFLESSNAVLQRELKLVRLLLASK